MLSDPAWNDAHRLSDGLSNAAGRAASCRHLSVRREVALQCGFCSSSHFSRVFREKTGLSPKLYRAQCRKKDARTGCELVRGVCSVKGAVQPFIQKYLLVIAEDFWMELLDGLHFIGDAELRVFVLTELVERKQMHLPHARLPQIRAITGLPARKSCCKFSRITSL